MSADDARADVTDGGELAMETTDYTAMLDTLDVAIEEARRKIESGRVYDEEKERVRIKWVRALAYAVNIRRQVAETRDLEELSAQVEELLAEHDSEV